MQKEEGTTAWLALRTDETTFWIVDAFPGNDERQAHLMGEVAASLGQQGIQLLAGAPEIMLADVLAAKL